MNYLEIINNKKEVITVIDYGLYSAIHKKRTFWFLNRKNQKPKTDIFSNRRFGIYYD